jgi:hypothetical protein
MAAVVEANVPSDPLGVTVLGSRGVMAYPASPAKAVEQVGRLRKRQLARVDVHDTAVEEVEGLASLFELADGVFFGLGDEFEEPGDLRAAEVARVAFAVEEDEAEGPVGVADAGLGAVEMGESEITELVEQRR